MELSTFVMAVYATFIPGAIPSRRLETQNTIVSNLPVGPRFSPTTVDKCAEADHVPSTVSVPVNLGIEPANVRLLELIGSYELLPVGWDGEAGLPASKQQIAAAKAFLDKLPAGIPLPSPQIAPTGAVGLYWDVNGVYADLEFNGDDSLDLYIRPSPDADSMFLEGVKIADVSEAWCWENLGYLSRDPFRAAA